MPIITPIGRKAWNIRFIIWGIYTVLSIGAVSMVYPFLMMLSLAMSSRADFKENQLVPRYFYSEDALFRKFAATKYKMLETFNEKHKSKYPDFGHGGQYKVLSAAAVNWPRIVAVPFDLADPRIKARVDDYREWKAAFIPGHWVVTTVLYDTDRYESTLNPLLDEFVDFLVAKYGSLEGINEAYNEVNGSLSNITAVVENPTFKTYLPAEAPKFADWREFKKALAVKDLEYIDVADIEGDWGNFLASKFSNEEKLNEVLKSNYKSIFEVPLSFTVPPEGSTPEDKEFRALWVEFAKNDVPLRYMSVADADGRYRRFLQAKYSDVATLNEFHGLSARSFDDVTFPSEITFNKNLTNDVYAFIASDLVRPEDITIKGPRWYWTEFLKAKYGTLEAADAAHSITYGDWAEVQLPRRLPLNETAAEQDDWKAFVREACPISSLLANFDRKTLTSFLSAEYGEVEKLNAAWGTEYASFEKVRPPKEVEITAGMERDLRKMLETQAVALFDVVIPDDVPGKLYQDFLRTRYASIADYNSAIRLYPSWDSVAQPANENEWADYQSKRKGYTTQFVTGNFSAVASYMALHGRAFTNTIILCTAMILAALTVNPLCAYALSRFQLSYANSILLFLLATMAFPVAATQIPNFLMLKELRLLNTFWALILPSLASGYSIFLLKGFFDSLPQELFEAGLIDGASEVQMFYRLALPLTKPILAVIALGAFTVAYGQFMWAFVVCQNPDYWTIMVWLYDYQADAAVPLVMASLVLASLPTLFVFVIAQNVILRGIVVPQMK
jgi:multiple sugar transport system permease protein